MNGIIHQSECLGEKEREERSVSGMVGHMGLTGLALPIRLQAQNLQLEPSAEFVAFMLSRKFLESSAQVPIAEEIITKHAR